MYKVGIIMPAYHAADTVVDTIERIPTDLLRRAGCRSELFIVDDGSSDGTGAAVRAAAPFPHLAVTLLTHPSNRGYGAALKTGLAASAGAGSDGHVILHSDGQYAPEELEVMLEPLRDRRADVVIGSKFKKGGVLRQGMPLPRMLGIRAADRLENRLLGVSGLEFHSGYMGYSAKALALIPFTTLTDGFHFDGEMALSAAKAGLKTEFVPISTSYAAGTSSLHPVPYLKELVSTVLRYRCGRYWFQREG